MGFARLQWNEGSGPATIEQTSNCGTARFMAPEVAVDNEDDTGSAQYSTAADIFSFGMMVYEIVSGETLPGHGPRSAVAAGVRLVGSHPRRRRGPQAPTPTQRHQAPTLRRHAGARRRPSTHLTGTGQPSIRDDP